MESVRRARFIEKDENLINILLTDTERLGLGLEERVLGGLGAGLTLRVRGGGGLLARSGLGSLGL